ncbi:zinc metalloprotease HtpX [Desulforamulus hydrothermalis]|uniref:Protease HtpX homolog n=1 Tax=Desulforamulus hydrothermalis Lam5 = DSM 18033 TaxID=1121428 RepID=K8DXF5_9FIRM|nr:zinc metalloprotease HtpX [Desulforamulus hydrothermalis]CCO07302.1 Protease HtpX homolog [Desulforamulus hydrothermalis Lam5 = DSM 18033]SHG93572.1 Heat shock protein. Metallo peptidase. MEROPS family M48B [Desulforamulus hydrothermalis Lam5 = DSM 18033]
MNTLKVWLLMGTLSVLLVLMGNAIGGQSGAMLFFLMAMAMNFFGYFYSDTLAIKMTGSYPVSEAEAPQLYAMVRRLSQRAGLPMPRIYIQPSPQPNAFATGRNPSHAAVAVTEGLLRLLDHDELEGVLAHELAHIKNRDVLVGTIAAALAGAISMIANLLQWGAILGMGRNSDEEEGGSMLGGLIMAMVAPIIAMIVQLAISRSREYMADATGAQIAGSPQGLANALLKLESAAHRIPMQVSPATSHLFIVNPLSGAAVARLFSTHPPIQDRVEKLSRLKV